MIHAAERAACQHEYAEMLVAGRTPLPPRLTATSAEDSEVAPTSRSAVLSLQAF